MLMSLRGANDLERRSNLQLLERLLTCTCVPVQVYTVKKKNAATQPAALAMTYMHKIKTVSNKDLQAQPQSYNHSMPRLRRLRSNF